MQSAPGFRPAYESYTPATHGRLPAIVPGQVDGVGPVIRLTQSRGAPAFQYLRFGLSRHFLLSRGRIYLFHIGTNIIIPEATATKTFLPVKPPLLNIMKHNQIHIPASTSIPISLEYEKPEGLLLFIYANLILFSEFMIIFAKHLPGANRPGLICLQKNGAISPQYRMFLA